MDLSADDLTTLETTLLQLLDEPPAGPRRKPVATDRVGAAMAGILAAAQSAWQARRTQWEAVGAICDKIGGGVRVYRRRTPTPALEYQNDTLTDWLAKDRSRRSIEQALDTAASALLGTKAADPVTPFVQVATRRADYLVSAARLGPEGSKPERVVVTIRTISLRPDAATILERARKRFRLTAAEARVAVLLAEGRRNAEIAKHLGVSPHTARHHTERIRRKLGVDSRAKAAALLLGDD